MNPSYALLAPLSESFFDVEKMRIADGNRAAAFAKAGLVPEADFLDARVAEFKRLERQMRKHVEDRMYELPIGDWIRSVTGLGPAVGLFIGLVGDPLWNQAEQRPRRGPQELLAYLGMDPRDGKTRRVKKGEQANFNRRARTILIGRIAESAWKQGGYVPTYRAAREKYADAVHSHECFNAIRPVAGRPRGSNGCGTQAHPEWGEVGSPLRDGHKHARARRAVARQFVLDLWNAAKAAQAE